MPEERKPRPSSSSSRTYKLSPWKAKDRLERGRVDLDLPHGWAAHDLQDPQRLAGDPDLFQQVAAAQAEGLQRAAAGHDVPERLVCDVGVAEGERAETGEPGRGGAQDGAEDEPAEREARQRVPGREQLAGQLHERGPGRRGARGATAAPTAGRGR
jgi:hypothetical protein